MTDSPKAVQASLRNPPLRVAWTRHAWLGCRIAILCLFPIFCRAQSSAGFTTHDVQAAYLYNFAKFVQWPENRETSSQPFSICLLGEDEFGRKLDDLIADETLQGRKIVARRLSSVSAAESCQIVFIGQSEEARLSKELAALNMKPVLTVSALPQFLERGGAVQFLLQNNRVRFAVNLASAQQAGLTLSSELLKVAVFVEGTAGKESKQ
jgi:hypothetical protein